MSSMDWEEVKRLAADFQKAQLGSTLQRFGSFSRIKEYALLPVCGVEFLPKNGKNC